jgi:hypothetical protein
MIITNISHVFSTEDFKGHERLLRSLTTFLRNTFRESRRRFPSTTAADPHPYLPPPFFHRSSLVAFTYHFPAAIFAANLPSPVQRRHTLAMAALASRVPAAFGGSFPCFRFSEDRSSAAVPVLPAAQSGKPSTLSFLRTTNN